MTFRCWNGCGGFCESICRPVQKRQEACGLRSMTLLSLSFHRTIKRRALHTSCLSSLIITTCLAPSPNNDFLSFVVASVSGHTASSGLFTCFDLRAAAPLLDTRLSYSRIITTTTHTLASHSSWSALLLLPPVWSASSPSPTQRCRSSLWRS